MLELNQPIPEAIVGMKEKDEIVPVNTRDLFTKGVYILVGVPGAFTPICTNEHLPTLIQHAIDIKVQGIQEIYCISDDNPWALEAWGNTLEDSYKIKFLSDGNREFLRQIEMRAHENDYFLKGKYARFYALIENGHIKRMRTEDTVLETQQTKGETILSDVSDFV